VCRAVSRRQDGTDAVDQWICLLIWTVPRRPGGGGAGGQGHSHGRRPVPLSPTSLLTSPGAIFTWRASRRMWVHFLFFVLHALSRVFNIVDLFSFVHSFYISTGQTDIVCLLTYVTLFTGWHDELFRLICLSFWQPDNTHWSGEWGQCFLSHGHIWTISSLSTLRCLLNDVCCFTWCITWPANMVVDASWFYFCKYKNCTTKTDNTNVVYSLRTTNFTKLKSVWPPTVQLMPLPLRVCVCLCMSL